MTYYGPVEESSLSKFWLIGFLIIIIGFILVFAGTLLSIQESQPTNTSTSVGVGGCVIIFFIPICFGTGGLWIIAMVLGIILTAITFAIYFFARRSF